MKTIGGLFDDPQRLESCYPVAVKLCSAIEMAAQSNLPSVVEQLELLAACLQQDFQPNELMGRVEAVIKKNKLTHITDCVVEHRLFPKGAKPWRLILEGEFEGVEKPKLLIKDQECPLKEKIINRLTFCLPELELHESEPKIYYGILELSKEAKGVIKNSTNTYLYHLPLLAFPRFPGQITVEYKTRLGIEAIHTVRQYTLKPNMEKQTFLLDIFPDSGCKINQGVPQSVTSLKEIETTLYTREEKLSAKVKVKRAEPTDIQVEFNQTRVTWHKRRHDIIPLEWDSSLIFEPKNDEKITKIFIRLFGKDYTVQKANDFKHPLVALQERGGKWEVHVAHPKGGYKKWD